MRRNFTAGEAGAHLSITLKPAFQLDANVGAIRRMGIIGLQFLWHRHGKLSESDVGQITRRHSERGEVLLSAVYLVEAILVLIEQRTQEAHSPLIVGGRGAQPDGARMMLVR